MGGTLGGTKVQVGTPASAQRVLQALAAGLMPTANPMGAMQAEQHMRNGSDVASGLMLDAASTQAFAQSVDAWLATGGLTPYQPPLALPPRQLAQLNRRMSALVAQNKAMLPFANAPTNPQDSAVPAQPVTREPSRDRLHAMARTDLSSWLAGLGDNVIVKSDDLTPPKAVQAACQRGLDLAPEHGGEGLTSGAISRARSMAAGNAVSSETIGRMASFFARHGSYPKESDPPSPGYVSWQLWGGDAGKAWANAKSDTAKAGGKNLVGGNTGAWKTAENAARGKANPKAYAAKVYANITKKALPMSDRVLSSYLSKAAGDRGGHVIGTTSSGKPIYDSSHKGNNSILRAHYDQESVHDKAVGAHPTYTASDHLDAAEQHQTSAAQMTRSDRREDHHALSQAHSEAAMSMTRKFGKSSSQNGKTDMISAATILKSYLSKAGEGSRGGKIIGHTKSGKPVYASAQAHKYENFSSSDHEDAAKIHAATGQKYEDKANFDSKGYEKNDALNQRRADKHSKIAEQHRQAS